MVTTMTCTTVRRSFLWGVPLDTPLAINPETSMQAAPLAFPYLILLHAEFGCFHSSGSPEISRSRNQDLSPGHSLCSTVPRLTAEGRYPLRCLAESGLSSPARNGSERP